MYLIDFPGGSDGKASAYKVGDPGSISGSGRSPGEGNGNPLQYSCLENPMDGGAWSYIEMRIKITSMEWNHDSLEFQKLLSKLNIEHQIGKQ